jgi:RNA polymerase sigma factor (sigma-70 family)
MSTGDESRREVPDEELVRLFQLSGDGQYFGQLFDRHKKRIFAACRAFTNDAGTAEDATQETFYRAFVNIKRFQGGQFGAWLMRIATNFCTDHWRKHRRETGMPQPEAEKAAPACSASTEWRLRDVANAIMREMQNLSPEQRVCLQLKIEGYSYQETAARTGFSIDAVKSYLQNGRRMLWQKTAGTISQLR